MKHTYKVVGMTCTGCQEKISETLNFIPNITAKIDIDKQSAEITSTETIDLDQINEALAKIGNYKIELLDSNSNFIKPQDRHSPSSVYYCPMECEGDKVYFTQGERCPTCKMYLVPIEEKLAKDPNYKEKYSVNNLPQNFKTSIGKYYCPMFCEDDVTFDTNVGCNICGMDLEIINEDLIKNGTFATHHHVLTTEPTMTTEMAGKYYCPMFCEGDKVYDDNVGCPVCGMDLVKYPTKDDDGTDHHYISLRNKFWIALAFTFPVFVLSMGSMFYEFSLSPQVKGIIELLFTLPVLLYSGWFIMKRGWTSFKTWNLNMFSLIALGVFAAFAFSIFALLFPNLLPHEIKGHSGHIPLYFEAVCVILTLVILGQLMEAAAHKKTGNAIKELMSLSPDEAHLMTNGNEENVSLSQVKINDVLKVKPGEKIPVDGVIIEGASTIDESMITGEPLPAYKTLDDKVTSGTINGNHVFLMKAEKVGDKTLLSQIIKMVNDASRSRAPIQNLTDKVSKIFVPTVIFIAAITFVLWQILGPENQKTLFAFINAVAVLIVACPCALGLATPMSLMVGIGKGAKNGVLIKNAEALEQMDKVNVLITDKTGTLTEGKPSLEIIQAINDLDPNEILKIAATLNQNSEHPLSNAVLNKAKDLNIAFEKISNFENILGKGLIGNIYEKKYALGNEALLKDLNIAITPEIEDKVKLTQSKAQTISYLVQENKILGFLSFSDKIKPTSKDAISKLQEQGIEVIMMTGDNQHTAEKVALELGIKTYKANCLPQDKLNEVKRLQNEGKIVAMTGDGINDAPALAQANIGIAMGTGTDIAMESAEITLLKGNILGVVKAKTLSNKLLKNIKENLFFAFIYNIVGIPIAAGLLYPFFGILMSPMIAAAAMSISSLSVIINSLRLNAVDLNPLK